jgi:hypothetical protein
MFWQVVYDLTWCIDLSSTVLGSTTPGETQCMTHLRLPPAAEKDGRAALVYWMRPE